jgi:4-hydroxybenzoate polyprenyltransferase
MNIFSVLSSAPDDSHGQAAGWREYLQMARLDHMTKHVFILPGLVLAIVFRGVPDQSIWWQVPLGLASAVLIASANYIINEWLDREFDAFHPDKSARPAVNTVMSAAVVYGFYALVSGAGLLMAHAVGPMFLYVSVLFWLSGIVYNVYPFRTKDMAYLDVLSESINNPLRMMLGWAMVDQSSIAPSSLLLAYWMGGAFLMATKRLSEFREIAAGPGVQVLHRYRNSFRQYTAESLTISCFVYALFSIFLMGVFLIKYRIEYVLAVPLVVMMFAHYLALAMRTGSVAQKPEKLFRERRLMGISSLTVAALALFTFVDVPLLHGFSEPHFILIGAR